MQLVAPGGMVSSVLMEPQMVMRSMKSMAMNLWITIISQLALTRVTKFVCIVATALLAVSMVALTMPLHPTMWLPTFGTMTQRGM